MNKQIVDGYRVSGNQITYIKLSKVSLPENETLSMLNRYRFGKGDEKSKSEEIHQNTEKNFQENNKISYLEMYRELAKYSSWELFMQLYNNIFSSSEKKKLLQNTIFIFVLSCFIIICTLFDKSKDTLALIRIPSIIIGILCIVAPSIIAILIFSTIKQVVTNMIGYPEKKIEFMKPIIYVGGVIFSVLNINIGFNIIDWAGELDKERDNIEFVEAAELYKSKPNSTKKKDNQIIENDEEDAVIKLSYSDNFIDIVEETYKSIEYEYFGDLTYKNKGVIAQDISGKEYTISQLSNQKLLIPYMDGEKAVLFYGQYNNYYWDGDCIFNIYEYSEDIGKNILTTILEAKYDKGSLVSYKRIDKITTGQGVDVWSISDRIRENGYNCGETYYYFQLNDYLQDFDLNAAGVENIIYVDNFENILIKSSTIEGYYYGNTSDGYYNDDTGNAYMVKYADDGTIRTLYRGGFKNGSPDDQTGNAWQIVFDNSYNINRYFYYKGMFKNGKRVGRVSSDNYVEQVEIDQIIDSMTFACPLNWYTAIE